jgi:hypothetical protein
MQRDHAYRKLQALLLQEFHHKHLIATDEAVEDFIRLAAAQGLYIDDLIRLAESGLSGQQIAEAVIDEESRRVRSTKSFGGS